VTTLLVAHSGGPTVVINASLAGIVEEARRHPDITSVLGARFGIDGILAEDFVDLFALKPAVLAAVAGAAGSALGTSRRPMTSEDIERTVSACRDRDIRFLLYTGGNGSMGTAHDIDTLARDRGVALSVVGVPKTIDNDLAVTDHAPGYASAARFFACAARDIGADNRALPAQVQVLEALGRHAGWIAAATSLAGTDPDDAPHLVYLPERPLPLDTLLDDVQRVYDRLRRCLVVVCEGQLDDRGEPFGADVRASSRGPLATNLAHRLASAITERLGLKARGEKPGLLGRASAELRSDVDWREAKWCGEAAVRTAIDGASGVMVTLEREPGLRYAVATGTTPLSRVAGIERRFPLDWIGADGHSVVPAFRQWAAPLVGALDRDVWI